MERRHFLKQIGCTGMIFGITSGVVQADSDRSFQTDDDIYETLEAKYGEKEALIITRQSEEGTEPADILTDPRLENARRDYLEYRHSTSTEQEPDIDSGIIDAATPDTLRAVKGKHHEGKLVSRASSPDLDIPCYTRPSPYSNGAEPDRISKYSSGPATFSSFHFRHVSESSYGAGTTRYTSDCYYANATRMRARVTGAIYGGGTVKIRHLAAGLGDSLVSAGNQTIVAEFDASGTAPGGDAELSIVVLSDRTDAFESQSVESISTSINRTVRGQADFDLSEGDMIGAELEVSADGAAGAAMTDFHTITGPSDRGATPTLELYDL